MREPCDKECEFKTNSGYCWYTTCAKLFFSKEELEEYLAEKEDSSEECYDVKEDLDNRMCKYYTKHLDTIHTLIGALYSLEECSCGGLLHILLDDDNIEDNHIAYCLSQCIKQQDREECGLGKLICEEYLRISMPERRLLAIGRGDFRCVYCNLGEPKCCECDVETGRSWE